PAEALAGELETGGVEQGCGDGSGADQALVVEGGERAPAAVEEVAVAAVVERDLVPPGAAGRRQVDPGAVVGVVGELVARADVVLPAQRNLGRSLADRVRGRR